MRCCTRFRMTLVLLASLALTLPALAAKRKEKAEAPEPSKPSYELPQPEKETLNYTMYQRIREEGLAHSHVMEYASALMDGIGPRLAGSPNLARGNAWTREAPIFAQWIEPLKDLGVTTISMRNTGGTDHESFDAVGIPGFQFIQDPMDYGSRTHHSNMDTYERLQPGDLAQAATVEAIFVYNAAMRDQMLPRKPLPDPELEEKRDAPLLHLMPGAVESAMPEAK